MSEHQAILEGAVFRLLEPALLKGKVKQGERVKLKVVRPRSRAQHNLLFHALAVLYDTWPEGHRFQPLSQEHLRYWLEVKAGWGQKIPVTTKGDVLRVSTAAWTRPVWFEVDGEDLFACIPRSIAYDKMQPEDFKQLVEKIDEILQREVGMSLSDAKESAIDDVR